MKYIVDRDELIEAVKKYFINKIENEHYRVEATECNADIIKMIYRFTKEIPEGQQQERGGNDGLECDRPAQ